MSCSDGWIGTDQYRRVPITLELNAWNLFCNKTNQSFLELCSLSASSTSAVVSWKLNCGKILSMTPRCNLSTIWIEKESDDEFQSASLFIKFCLTKYNIFNIILQKLLLVQYFLVSPSICHLIEIVSHVHVGCPCRKVIFKLIGHSSLVLCLSVNNIIPTVSHFYLSTY